jgi:hypothetical protein
LYRFLLYLQAAIAKLYKPVDCARQLALVV